MAPLANGRPGAAFSTTTTTSLPTTSYPQYDAPSVFLPASGHACPAELSATTSSALASVLGGLPLHWNAGSRGCPKATARHWQFAVAGPLKPRSCRSPSSERVLGAPVAEPVGAGAAADEIGWS